MSGIIEFSADAKSKTIGNNYRCRSWVNFNGTGTVAIRASGNVSSITDNGTGDYTINFIKNMIDTNYLAVPTSDRVATTDTGNVVITTMEINYANIRTYQYGANTTADVTTVGIAVFR